MHDPARIEEFLGLLREVGSRSPDLGLGQLIVNAVDPREPCLDMVRHFRVPPPSVRSMVVKLHQLGLITRETGVARSICVAIPEQEIPRLEGGRS